MKKFAVLLVFVFMLAFACAEGAGIQVYVSISDDTGALVLARQAVTVTDTDADGVLTIRDALEAAHAAHHASGAEAFAAQETEYGLSMTRLWGVENGGSYGYCLNDASAMSMADPVAEGDHVKAYAYTDLVAWSDMYSFFASGTLQAAAGTEIALELLAAGYDANWMPVTLPVAGAELLLDGQPTGIITDDEGKAVLTIAEEGQYVLSARSDAQTLVPPVCIITVSAR